MGSLQPGTVLHGRYKIEAQVGQGAMAVVYGAHDQQTGKHVAVKQMGMYVDSPEEKELAVQQFEHEAQLLHSLEHENIPRVHEWFEDGDERYLVMDFVDGDVLSKQADIAAKGEHTPAFLPTPLQVVEWSVQITRALQYLHGQKPKPIIYKDLKPDNLMLQKDGRIMLLDFGIAKGRDAQGQYKTILKGMVTPGYGAPEQYSGVATDPRTDLYALGATIYALLSGHVPPQAVDRHEAIFSRRHDPLVPLRTFNPNVSPELEHLVMRLMALKREHRPPNADYVMRELEALPEYVANVRHQAAIEAREAEARKRRATMPLLIVGIVLVIICIALGIWYLIASDSKKPKPPRTKPKASFSQPSPPRSASAWVRSGSDPTGGATTPSRPA